MRGECKGNKRVSKREFEERRESVHEKRERERERESAGETTIKKKIALPDSTILDIDITVASSIVLSNYKGLDGCIFFVTFSYSSSYFC